MNNLLLSDNPHQELLSTKQTDEAGPQGRWDFRPTEINRFAKDCFKFNLIHTKCIMQVQYLSLFCYVHQTVGTFNN